MMNPHRTDFLFPTASFLLGVGSCLNIAGGYYQYNAANSDNEADLSALRSDWNVVGEDIRTALRQAKAEAAQRG